MSDERRRIELQLKMLQLKKDKAIAMQTAPVGGAATTAPEPEQSPVQQLGGANFDPNSVYDQTVKRASDVAGGLIKGGVADLIDLPVNMVNLGADALNSVGVENDFQMIPPTDISFLKKAKEMLTARQVPRFCPYRLGVVWFTVGKSEKSV